MLDIQESMEKLAKARQIFHSEADFQHSFAWEIQRTNPNCEIRLERPFADDDRSHLDLLVIDGSTKVAIELKYKTRGLREVFKDEKYNLLNQSAQAIGRYDVLKDVQRVEKYVNSYDNCYGDVIFLTNDSAYWKTPTSYNPVDAAFRLHEGASINGSLKWDEGASEGTKKDREDPITIKGKYLMKWIDYSQLTNSPYGAFKYLNIKIEKRDTDNPLPISLPPEVNPHQQIRKNNLSSNRTKKTMKKSPYEKLGQYLNGCSGKEVTLTYAEIEKILEPQSLPPSAYNYSAWWNPSDHPHTRAWTQFNWSASRDARNKSVIFRKNP